MAARAVKPFRITRAGRDLGTLDAASPLAALAAYAAEHGLVGVQQGRSTLAVDGYGLLRAENVAVCSCGPRKLEDVYWDGDSTCRCRRCRLPLHEDPRRVPALSERQLSVLQFLCLGGAATAGGLLTASGGGPNTLTSLVGLGLIECRTVGGRGSLYRLTKFGRDTVCAHQEDDPAGRDRRDSSRAPAGPLHETEVHTMNATATETKKTDDAPKAAAKPAAEKPDFKPLFEELLGAVKGAVKGTKEVKKSNYVRVALGTKTVAYVNFPNSKGVKVSVPKKGGSGYDDIKATSSKDAPKVLAAVEAHIKSLTEAPAAA